MPCVNVGTKDKPILLPPELATVLPDQSFKGKLMDIQTREMIKHACRSPRQNAEAIVNKGQKTLKIGKDHSSDLVSAVIPCEE